MTETLEQLETWMQAKENEHLQFKEATNHFDFDEPVTLKLPDGICPAALTDLRRNQKRAANKTLIRRIKLDFPGENGRFIGAVFRRKGLVPHQNSFALCAFLIKLLRYGCPTYS